MGHPLLQRIFIVVSFVWNVHGLAHLELTLRVFQTYPTHVGVVIVTNNEPALSEVLATWSLPLNVSVWNRSTVTEEAFGYGAEEEINGTAVWEFAQTLNIFGASHDSFVIFVFWCSTSVII